MKLVIYISIAITVSGLSSCASVKPYEKMYLNDSYMDLGLDGIEGGEFAFQSYREGASGGTGGKVGGGCGCN